MNSWPFSQIHNPLKVKDLRKIRKQVNKLRHYTFKQWLKLAGWAVAIGLGFLALLFIWYAKDLPTPQGIRHRLDAQETTNIYDRTGEHLLYAISGQQRRLSIPFSEMPTNVKQAVIAIEDKDFYKHKGVDFRGLARAAIKDILTLKKSQGGSTITQQLVKNAIIGSNQKFFSRKIKEAILSVEIEAMYSKDQILALYLNEIPFGGNAYGVEAAAETFFGKKAKDLSLSESATLAAVLQAPSYYSPYGSHVQRLIDRRNIVLTLMVKENYITAKQANEAKDEKLVTIAKRDTILAPHFVVFVRDIIAEKYGEDIFAKGLNIITSLDIEQQKAAEQAISNGAAANKAKYGADNAAMVSLNPKTGEVLSMVGSADFFNNEINGQFNVTTAKRQPGSAFKPLVYAAALKQKFNPASIFYDLPTTFGNTYKPNDFDGRWRGPVTMRQAIGQSLNMPAVKTLALVGIKEALRTAGDLGITTLDTPEKYGLSLVLGAAEVKPIELAQAYGVFAAAGVRQDIVSIIKVTDKSGRVLEEFKPEDHRKVALDPQIAFEMNDMLADQNAKAPVFGNLLSFSGRTVASKTGTTNGVNKVTGANDVRDAWTVGYVPSLVTAIWVGNNNHSALGKGTLAADAAVPIFRQYMNAVLPHIANENFNRPNTIQTVTVDRLSNKLPSDASPPDQQITDIFAPWQVPTKQDDIHIKVNLCKGTNQLATDETPADQIEQKYFVNIHSEKPGDPAWEGPVRQWATDNGLNNLPPTDQCTAYTSQNRPNITIVTPVNGATESDAFDIEAAAGSPFGVSQVVFAIDGETINTDQGAPYTSKYNAINLSNGTHTITATATGADGRTSTATATINVNKESTPPANVSAATATPGKGQALLSWTNPGDNDLSRTRIYITQTAGGLGLRYAIEPLATPGSVSTITISGLASGQTYYFTLRPVDSDNNENQSVAQVAAVVQ